MEQVSNVTVFAVGPAGTDAVSPYIFGHNLEHTRGAVCGGLSAQMVRNRKFAGKGAANCGVALPWFGIGEKALFQITGSSLFQSFSPVYTRHVGCEKMKRRLELQAQDIQNLLAGQICGIGQQGMRLTSGRRYELRVVTMAMAPLTLTVSLTDAAGGRVYDQKELSLVPGDWQVSAFTLSPDGSDGEGCLRITFTERGRVVIGAVSMLPENSFHGMRRDVVERLREIGPALIRWPGGNFSGEYRWMDGLLPADERGPLQSAMESETQPYTGGFDSHEIGTDDFLALCREIGAEPLITVNAAWSTPEESAAWVEYCNGGPDTKYGRIRAERGHPEPYRVRFWALGNEMGYEHMEGPSGPSAYAALAASHADAMLAVCPDLVLFSSGPYPNDDWAVYSAAALLPRADFISLHHYCSPNLDYTAPEAVRETYLRVTESVKEVRELIRETRTALDRAAKGIRISFDEWNQWYAWHRPSCVAEGIFTAKMLHLFLELSGPMDMPVCCYFQPVGEGGILITEDDAVLTANGQVFALMKAHKGGSLCPLEGAENGCVMATQKDGKITVTMISDGYDEGRTFRFPVPGTVQEARLLCSGDVCPHSRFEERALPYRLEDFTIEAVLPPHSIALLQFAAEN